MAASALRFGLPLAAANMLSWALLNVDNVVISRTSGAVALGFYVLAFNVSSWPMTAIGQAIRPVTLAAFSRVRRESPDAALARTTALTTTAAVPVGALLAVLALPVVLVLYGDRWTPSAAALAGLGAFGALRILMDVLATYLIARGQVSAVLWTQVIWIVGLVPAMLVGIHWGGLAGAGWAHLAVGVVLVLPVYLMAVRRSGARVGSVLGHVWQPVVAMAPAAVAAHLVAERFGHPLAALFAGGVAGSLVYAAFIGRWALRWVRSGPAPEPAADAAVAVLTSPAGPR